MLDGIASARPLVGLSEVGFYDVLETESHDIAPAQRDTALVDS